MKTAHIIPVVVVCASCEHPNNGAVSFSDGELPTVAARRLCVCGAVLLTEQTHADAIATARHFLMEVCPCGLAHLGHDDHCPKRATARCRNSTRWSGCEKTGDDALGGYCSEGCRRDHWQFRGTE